MSDLLVLILSIIGFFALYWVFFGQWKYNKQMREAEMKRVAKEIKDKIEKEKKEKKK